MDISKLALYLGMIIGDGHISNRNNGFGYPTYSINFYNTFEGYVQLIYNLHKELFGEEGKINSRKRINRKRIYDFCKYSRSSFDFLTSEMKIPFGRKCDIVRIPKFIFNSSNSVKIYFFLGLFLTDGGLSGNKITFHMASKSLLFDLSRLIKEIWGFESKVIEVVQKRKYFSYQLNLKKKESNTILNQICRDRIIWYCTDSEELILQKCKP